MLHWSCNTRPLRSTLPKVPGLDSHRCPEASAGQQGWKRNWSNGQYHCRLIAINSCSLFHLQRTVVRFYTRRILSVSRPLPKIAERTLAHAAAIQRQGRMRTTLDDSYLCGCAPATRGCSTGQVQMPSGSFRSTPEAGPGHNGK